MTDDVAAALPRVNVFALPSETTLRFLLLVGVFIGSVLVVSESLYYTVRADRLNVVLQQCEGEAVAIADPVEHALVVNECRAPHERERVVWTVATLGGALAIALLAVVVRPAVRRTRRRLQTLPRNLEVHVAIEDACASVGATTVPAPVWDPRRLGGAAEVWWRPGRQEIELSPGLVSALRRRTPEAMLVLRHEAAHVRNRDLVLGAVTDAATIAFLLTAVAPLAIMLFVGFDGPRTTIATALARLGVVFLVVLLARAATLRSRELDADGRAALAGPAAADFLADSHGPGAGPTRWRAFAHHPSQEFRTATIVAPVRLLRTGLLDGFVAGFATFLYLPTITRLVEAWLTGTTSGLDAQVWVAASFALPLGVWLGVAAARLAAATAIDGRMRPGLAVGTGLAAGAVVGLLLFDEPLYQPITLLDGGAVEALALALLALGLVGLASWAVAVAGAWLRGLPGGPRSVILPIVGMTCLGLVVVAAKLCETWRNARIGSQLVTGPGSTTLFGTAQLVWLVATSMWFTALSAVVVVGPLLVRSRAVGIPTWLVGATPATQLPPRRGMGWSVIAGLTTGAVAIFVFFVYDARIRSITTQAEFESSPTAFRYVLIAELAVVAVSLLGGLVVATVTTGRTVLLGVFTVGIASAVGSVGVMQVVRRSAPFDWELISDVAGEIVPLAVVGAIATASLMSLLGGRLRHRRPLVAVGAVAVTVAVVGGLGLGSAAYAASTLPARREALGEYQAWWNANAPFVAETIIVCSGDDLGPLDGDPGRLAATAEVIDGYRPRTSPVEDAHRHLQRAVDQCQGVLDAAAAGTERQRVDALLALLDELAAWTTDVSALTDQAWVP